MSQDVSMNISDHEYGLIRNHLSPSMAAFFDGLKASGARLGDSINGGSKTPYIIAWHRAVNKAEGLTRYPRIHDLRVTKMRQDKGSAE